MPTLILKRSVNCLATSFFRNTGVWFGQSQHRHYWKHQFKSSRGKKKTRHFQPYRIYQNHFSRQRTMKHLHRGKLRRNSASWGSPKRFLYGTCSQKKKSGILHESFYQEVILLICGKKDVNYNANINNSGYSYTLCLEQKSVGPVLCIAMDHLEKPTGIPGVQQRKQALHLTNKYNLASLSAMC